MVFDEKVDVIDLIINVLKDHEKTLDTLISKLEEALTRTTPMPTTAISTGLRRPSVSVVLRRWAEFRERCVKVSLIAFDIEDKRFKVSAIKDDIHYSYQEEMPDMEIKFRENEEKAVIDQIGVSSTSLIPTVIRGVLECGLGASLKGVEVKMPDGGAIYKVIFDIENEEATNWLADQLKVDKKHIVQGKIQI
jgi:hypothetical protein